MSLEALTILLKIKCRKKENYKDRLNQKPSHIKKQKRIFFGRKMKYSEKQTNQNDEEKHI